ncbi:hypothetical protein ACFYMI_36195 [Streptomyces collinus]|uniref:hypothetical protein n=1 Tax=Streptomyces collinus TaxID=42684 RepID=UPI00369736F7
MDTGETGRLVGQQDTFLLPPGEVLEGLQLDDVGDEGAGGELVVDAGVPVTAGPRPEGGFQVVAELPLSLAPTLSDAL